MIRQAMIAVVVALFVGFSAVFSVAQTADTKASDRVKIGVYRDLSFLRTVKLETAAYVNPDLLKKSATAYKFKLSAFSEISDTERLKELFNSGELALAVRVPKDSGWKVLPHSEVLATLKHYEGSAPQTGRELPWITSPENYILVSHMKTLSGVEAAGEIVSWSATEPVVPCRDCLPGNSSQPK